MDDRTRAASRSAAGVTIGTVADNGYTFAGKVLLVIVFPGPILLIEGKANLLKERAKLDEEPLFRALRCSTGAPAPSSSGSTPSTSIGSGGELIDIRGSAEAFFDFSDADAWHLYLGRAGAAREAHPRRDLPALRGQRLLHARRRQAGDGRLGRLRQALEVRAAAGDGRGLDRGQRRRQLEAGPFHGDLWLHGKAELRVFGFGLRV